MHAEKAQSVEERERELAGIASVLSKRSSLQFDEFFVELSLLGRKRSEQIVSDFGRKRGAENRRSGSTQNKLIGNARELGMSVESERTSADRMAANSRSASLQPLRRPASMGRTNSCRKEASEENTPGLTNSDSAKSSWRMRKTSLADFQIVLDGRAGEKNAATRGELEQTVDRGVAGGALETMALVADEKSGLAAIDGVGVFAIHLDEKESKQVANLIRNHQHDAIQSRLHHEIADFLFCLRSLLLQHDASNPIASNPLSTPHSSLSTLLPKLSAPIVHQRRRTRHHGAGNQWLRPGRLSERCEDQTDRCECFAEAHFIGEDAARSVVWSQAVDAVVEEEKTFFLVGLELGGERGIENDGGRCVAFRVDEAVLDHERVGSFGVQTGLKCEWREKRKKATNVLGPEGWVEAPDLLWRVNCLWMLGVWMREGFDSGSGEFWRNTRPDV